MNNLTQKEICELRIKCLEPFVSVASKHGIEQDIIFSKAEKAWEFAIKPLGNTKQGISESQPPTK